MNKSKFVDKIDQYYKSKKSDIEKKINFNKSYKINFYVDDQDNHIVDLIDENGDVILKAEYDLLGIFNVINSTWYWGWNIQMADKLLTKASKKIKNFPDYIKSNYNHFTHHDAEYFNFITDTGNFFTDQSKINDIVKFGLYYLNGLWYLSICTGRDEKSQTCYHNSNNTAKHSDNIIRFEYIIIKNILKIK